MKYEEWKMDKIAVLIPCYNEEKNIAKVVSDVKKFLPQAVKMCIRDSSIIRGRVMSPTEESFRLMRTGITTSIQSNRQQNWCRWWETACWYCIREICNTLIFPMM